MVEWYSDVPKMTLQVITYYLIQVDCPLFQGLLQARSGTCA